MEESLKAIRFTYRAMLALIAAILLFALSPDKYRTYESAYGFLDKLEAIDEDAYSNWAEKISNQKLVSRHQLLKNIVDEVEHRGGPIIEWEHIENGTVGGGLTFYHTTPRINDSTIESINRTFREDLRVQAPNLSIGRIASIITNDLDPSKKYRVDDFTISGTVGIGRMDVQLYLYDEAGNLEHVLGTAKFDTRPIDGKSFQVWIDEIQQADIISIPDTNGIVFKPLRPVWKFIYSKSISDGKDWLQQEMIKQGEVNVLNMLGISISEFQASVAAPALTLFFLLALASQIRHANQLSLSTGLEILKTFPWIPAFSGNIGFTARLLTIFTLPVVANFWLLVRVKTTANVYFGWIEWGFLVVASIWAYVESSKISNRNHCEEK